VIPTYRRGLVLLQTIDYLLAMDPGPAEILIVDQTESHDPEIRQKLTTLDAQGLIRWIVLEAPSITHAMNCGLIEAREQLVLFLDDDIRPEPGLIDGHFSAHMGNPGVMVAGRVIQPWEEGADIPDDGAFRFCGLRSAWIDEFMGGNFSLRRDGALALGGFDENFVRVAYRFEKEFAHRFRAAGNRIYFEPAACLHHLKEVAGGTRTFGDFLTTWRPDHAVGAYYYALRARPRGGWLLDFISRPIRAVSTRHHLRHPWSIPLTWFAELRGMGWAILLAMQGPRLVKPGAAHG
jgi:glycosyltransferase involved in cell wall biosynthesis